MRPPYYHSWREYLFETFFEITSNLCIAVLLMLPWTIIVVVVSFLIFGATK